MQVRREEPSDREAVGEIHRAAFGDQGEWVARLVDGLRAGLTADNGLSLVAIDSGTVVGHVMFTTSLLDAPSRLVDVQVLSPVGVLPARQRRGIGSLLISTGLQALAERSIPLVFLEGSPVYYPRFGFVPAKEAGFRKPSLRIPDAGFQVKLLPAFEPWMTGTLVYSHTFWDHDAVGLRDSRGTG